MKRQLRRGTALLLCMALLFGVSACGGGDDADLLSTTEETTLVSDAQIRYNDLRLPYARSDSLDPYEAKSTVNRQLMTLLFDGLFTVGEDFEAKPVLAKEYSTDGQAITVSVNSDVRFHDGSLVTAADVLYSFRLAKESPAYKARLKNIESASGSELDSILFLMNVSDPYAAACLDFPIVKSGTGASDRKETERQAREAAEAAGEEYHKSVEKQTPVGTGRYVLSYDEGESDPVLTAFHERYKGFYPSLSTIRLVNVTDSSALFYSLEIGNISFAFDDLSGGKYTRVNANISEYPMNSLVYLGMNQDHPALAQSEIRQAIQAAIDREDILNVAFQGHATVTHTPVNPHWTVAAEYESTYAREQSSALEMLRDAGFDKVNGYGVRNNGRQILAFTLLVAEGNGFKEMTANRIAQKLQALDIKVTIQKLPANEFVNAVELGKFDLYVGEVNLSPNMDLNVFFGGSGAAAHGIWSKAAGKAYEDFRWNEISFGAFMEAFEQDLPFIPLCFRNGIVASVKELEGTQNARYGDLFEDVEEWRFH